MWKKSPDKMSGLEKKLYKELSKKNFKKVEKLILEYNKLVDDVWSAGPSKYPLHKIRCVDKENAVLKREVGKCEFCGSDCKHIEILPYLFGTINFVNLCGNEKCRDAFEDYEKRYLNLLDQAHEDLSKYDLSSMR